VIRVLLADDQELVRAGFRALLEAEDDIEVVGEAVDGAHAVAEAARHRPDLVLMDVRMPTIDGIEATRRISARPDLAGVRILILTTYETDEHIFDGLRAGASGFLVKDTSPTELLRAVRVVASGDALLAPSVTRRVIAEVVTRAPHREPIRALADLTSREREILALVGGGLSNDEIAASLTITPATAKTHVGRIFGKLDARDRAQLVVIAYESGLVRPGAAPQPAVRPPRSSAWTGR
jgi:DNA-binding NarL/FixJ family response regulator